MEEQKLLKKKKKALNSSNKKYLAEICTELGDFYNRKGQYEDAFKEYEASASIYGDLKMKLENAQSHRMIGEMHMLLAEFQKALQHEEIYLNIARELNNKIEEQRALATLGRAYLLQGQSIENTNVSLKLFKMAEKSFVKSLTLCESLKGKINHQELMDMKARLLLNIGVVSEQLGDFERAIEFFNKTINMCKSCDLYNLLVQCYITEGMLYSSKHNNHSKAILCFNLALDVAERLENKIVKQCEILFLKSEALCKMSDFQSAKTFLMKAWKLRTPNDEEREDIERNLKIVAAICYTEDLLVTTNSDDFRTLKKLYEKMADGACLMKNYDKGVYFYLKMLDCAEKCGDTGKELVPIYVSLYQTYKDLKEYEKALEFNKKEFDLIENIPKEAFSTLINLAELMLMANKPYNEIETIYLQARTQAIKLNNKKMELKSLNLLKTLQIRFNLTNFVKQTENEISLLGHNDKSLEESSEEEVDDENSTQNVGDDICLDDLTDISDNENSGINIKKTTRKRGKTFTIKKNSKGETQLHQACISGNTLLVTRLLSQGHPVNVRDNAGWLPVHEACIHGHKDVVEILIENGAQINDRGGTQCDGITPMYDAASNGHLNIIEVLLNKGASPVIKNDYGETALDVLVKWRENSTLNHTEHIFYETLCGRMRKSLEKFGDSTVYNDKIHKDIRFQKSNKNDIISDHSDSDKEISNSPIIASKSRRMISDESSNSSCDSKTLKKDTIAVKEYQNAMNALRNKHFDTKINRKSLRNKKKGALLSPNEVGDDWLENDLLPNSKRRRKPSVENINPPKRRSNEINISPHKNLEENRSTVEISENNSDFITYSDDSLDSFKNLEDKIASNTSKSIKTSQSNRKFKRQTSLLRVGFSRHKSPNSFQRLKSNSINNSDNETFENFEDSFPYQEEADSTTENSCINCSPVKSLSTSSSIQLNSYTHSPNNTLNNDQKNSSHIPSAPITIRVKIKEKILLIPVASEKINFLRIDWLVQETCRRFYNIEGVQPTIELLTNDGALLANEDPLSIILGNSEITANITNWNLPPLGDRYIECCTQCEMNVDTRIKSLLEKSQATHSLIFSYLNLDVMTVKPIFKALNHQINLKHLILSNNNIGNDGLMLLSQSLSTLMHIESLDLSNNFIDADGIRHLLLTFERTKQPMCQQFQTFNISYNFLSGLGFTYILKLSKYVKFKYLNLRNNDIECKKLETASEIPNFQYLEHLDISLNSFEEEALYDLFHHTNKSSLITLEMEKINVSIFNSGILNGEMFLNLKKINLSRCNLKDTDVIDILRFSLRCEKLQNLNLQYNDSITFSSFKKVLLHRFFTHIDFEGCPLIFKNVGESDFEGNWFINERKNKLERLVISPEKSPENIILIDKLSNMWNEYWKTKTVINKKIFNLVTFSKSD